MGAIPGWRIENENGCWIAKSATESGFSKAISDDELRVWNRSSRAQFTPFDDGKSSVYAAKTARG